MSKNAQSGYQMPPRAIADLVDAPPAPGISLDPLRKWIAIQKQPSLPTIEELARLELRIAGIRIDPRANTRSRLNYFSSITLKAIEDGSERRLIGIPEGVGLGTAQWSPDGTHIALTVTTETERSLWFADVETGQARRVGDMKLNGVFGAGFSWMPDSRRLVVLSIPDSRGEQPRRTPVPAGPIIQENTGSVAPSRTYQDLLANEDDAALLEYYGETRVGIVNLDGQTSYPGPAGLVCRVDPSPDGAYLYVETVHRPFSYLVPYHRFPVRLEIWNSQGGLAHELSDLPLAEEVPIARDAVPTGPRGIDWRADAPATLAWAEALDGGDPDTDAETRDRVLFSEAPFTAEPSVLQDLGMRYAGIRWGSGNLALISERWWKTRRMRTWRIAPDEPGREASVLFDRSWEDRYSDPGSPLMRPAQDGTYRLLTDSDGSSIYLAGNGASPEGDFPFLDRLQLEAGRSERLWQCQSPLYEIPIGFTSDAMDRLLTLRESTQEPPNVYCVSLAGKPEMRVTDFPHPYPQLVGVQKELIRYKRADGVQLTGTLYLPEGYGEEDGQLPVLMWAYPREFKSAAAAGQMTQSPHRFVRVHHSAPLFWLLEGYAVLDGPTMPIVGEGEEEANDTYVEQLTASARAAVDELVRRGVADPDRVAVGGHSYGAFMAANLLAHTDLFAAGIARSGAYNRTLTPFGFQAEERTLWQAPEVYMEMSPFAQADKIEAPLLLIHGEADNNAGTFPMQSERLFNALKGHGATTRLVMLPLESHGYRGRESVMHMLWEMTTWLDKHVKGRRKSS